MCSGELPGPEVASNHRHAQAPGIKDNIFRNTPSNVSSIPHWPLPAVRDLTRDGRWSTYDESVLKLSKVSFRGKCARTGHPLKLPSPSKLARLGHFPPASQAGRLAAAGPVFYVYVFSLVSSQVSRTDILRITRSGASLRFTGTKFFI